MCIIGMARDLGVSGQPWASTWVRLRREVGLGVRERGAFNPVKAEWLAAAVCDDNAVCARPQINVPLSRTEWRCRHHSARTVVKRPCYHGWLNTVSPTTQSLSLEDMSEGRT
eukprot:1685746-Amphidinium_carterae.1